jgi:hypothetical protein
MQQQGASWQAPRQSGTKRLVADGQNGAPANQVAPTAR